MKYYAALIAVSVSTLWLTGCNVKPIEGDIDVTGVTIVLPDVCDSSQGLFAQSGYAADQLGVGYLGTGNTTNVHTDVFVNGESLQDLQTKLLPPKATHNYVQVAFALGDQLIPDISTVAEFKGANYLACKDTHGALIPLSFSLQDTSGNTLSDNTVLSKAYTGEVRFVGAQLTALANTMPAGVYLYDRNKPAKQQRAILNSPYKL